MDVPRGAVRKGWVRRGLRPRPGQLGWLSAEGRPSTSDVEPSAFLTVSILDVCRLLTAPPKFQKTSSLGGPASCTFARSTSTFPATTLGSSAVLFYALRRWPPSTGKHSGQGSRSTPDPLSFSSPLSERLPTGLGSSGAACPGPAPPLHLTSSLS